MKAKPTCGNCVFGDLVRGKGSKSDRICAVIGATFPRDKCGCGDDYYRKKRQGVEQWQM